MEAIEELKEEIKAMEEYFFARRELDKAIGEYLKKCAEMQTKKEE